MHCSARPKTVAKKLGYVKLLKLIGFQGIVSNLWTKLLSEYLCLKFAEFIR